MSQPTAKIEDVALGEFRKVFEEAIEKSLILFLQNPPRHRPDLRFVLHSSGSEFGS